MIAEAQRQAAALKDLPREELAWRFSQALEELRAEAIANGTAMDDGDLAEISGNN